MMKRTVCVLALLCCRLWATEPEAVMVPPRVPEPPVMDGILNEEIWQQATLISDFLQRLPKEGAEATEKSEVLVLYTDTSLYIGFRAYDNHPEKIVATVMKRDDFDLVQNDQFAFAIDSYNDNRNGYWFSTNPLGARVDAQFFDEGDLWESNWNGVWECKARIDATGWTAEIEIPFSTLRFQKAERNIMGINFFRRIIRTNEQLFAPLIPLHLSYGTPNVSAARKYRFDGIRGGQQLYVKPYGLAGFASDTVSGQGEQNAGLDVRYLITNNLTANFAARMDFAEADVDDRQVNLNRFRLFFPEKREFFLESSGNFLFGIPGETEVFFSRRIGLSDDGETPVPILFGGRLTGKIKKLDIGALDVQTDSTVFAPSENFGALRLKAGVAPRSYIGAIFTSRVSAAESSLTYGLDLNLHLHQDIFLSGYASTVETSVQKNSFSDSSAFYLALSRGGSRTSFRLAYIDTGRRFDPAIGFVQRPDTRRFQGNILVPYYTTIESLLSLTPGYEFMYDRDHHGNLISLFHEASFTTAFQSEDQFRIFATYNEEEVGEPFPVFRSITVPTGHFIANRIGVDVSTKTGRTLSGSLLISSGGFFDGERFEVSPSLVWKVSRKLSLSQSLSMNFVDLTEDAFNLYLLRTRISYSWNTRFSVSSVFQYDNSSQQMGVNFRAGYLFREGTEIFVVYNEIVDHRMSSRLVNGPNRSLLIKFTYLWNL